MAAMAPQLRQMFSNPQFQQMVSNPDALRQMFQMAGQMRAAGIDPTNPASMGLGGGGFGGGFGGMPFGFPNAFGGGAGGAGSPPATGATNTTTGAGAQPANLFAQAAGGGGAGAVGSPPLGGAPGANPFASLFGAGAPGAGGASPTSPNAGANPFGMVDPNLMQQMFGGFGGGAGAGGFGGGFGGGAPAAPADSRPPEERFQVQLQVRFIFFSCSLSIFSV